jgi:serine protease Do
MARTIVDQLRQFGEIRRGWLGVSIGIVEKEMAEAMGLDKARGALVQTVNDGGPAVNAGIKPGDIILKFDGRDVPDNRSLPRMVAETPIGKKVAVDLFRNGQAKTVTLEVGRLPDDPGKPSKPDSKGDKGDANTELASLGLRLAPLSPALRQKFNVPAEVKSGLVVVDVDVAKPAGEKLRPGDVIVEAQSKETTSVAALAERIKELESQSKKAIVLRVVRENPTPIFVAINIEKK